MRSSDCLHLLNGKHATGRIHHYGDSRRLRRLRLGDFGHAHLIGDAAEAVEVLSGHVITTHVHDNAGRSDDHLLPFAGTIDWDATLIALSKVGYPGPLMFELPDHGNAERTLDEAVGAQRRLQAILNDLADFAMGFEIVE
jgi:hypothetical protein